MDSKLLKICLAACVAAGFNACDTGEYNDLKCDSDYQSECLSRDVYMACMDGVLTTVLCDDNTYCSETEVNGVRAASCVPYGVNVNPTGQKCGNGQIDEGESCDGSNLNGKTCADLMVGATGNLLCDSSCRFVTTGCTVSSNDVCGDGIIGASEDCEGSNLNGKTCETEFPGSTGTLACDPTTCKFVQNSCEFPKEGSACDPDSFVEGCEGTSIVYCEEDDYGDFAVSKVDCSEYTGSACVILDNDGTNWADCLTEDLRCDNVDDEERQCQSYYGTPYSNISVCRSGSDGNNYWLEQQDDPDLLHVCNEPGALSCLSTTQDCGILSDDQGEECDPETFVNRCDDGEIPVYCAEDDESSLGGVVDAMECLQDKCLLIDGVPSCYEPCDVDGAEKYECEEFSFWGYTFATSYRAVCQAVGDNDGLFYVYEKEGKSCLHGCDTDNTCIVYSEHEGEACDEDYEPSCETSDVALNCYYDEEEPEYSEVEATSCAASYGEGYTCAIVKDEATCIQACDTVGEAVNECEYSEYYGAYVAYYSTCVEDGDLTYLDLTGGMICSNGCNADNTDCIKTVEDEGSKCDPDTFEERCDDVDGKGIVVYCDEGVVTTIDCSKGNSICAIIEDTGMANCYSEDDECDTLNDKIKECGGTEGDIYSGTYICAEADNGKTYYSFVAEESGYCSNGTGECDNATGECIITNQLDGQACDPDANIRVCEGDTIAICNAETSRYYTIVCHVDDEDTVCKNSSAIENWAGCVETCTNPGTTVSYTCATSLWTGESSLYAEICEELDDGNYWFTKPVSSCANGCNDDYTGCAE